MLSSSTYLPFVSLFSDVPLIVSFVFLSPLYCVLTLQFLSSQQQRDQFVSSPLSLACSLSFPFFSPILEIELLFSQMNVSMTK